MSLDTEAFRLSIFFLNFALLVQTSKLKRHSIFVLYSKEPAGSRSFETVKHGSRSSENPADRRPKLDLENKYDALRRS